MPKNYKICLTTSLLFWTLNLCSDFIKLHHEVDKLESIFHKNSYPRDLVKTCIKGFLEKILAPKTMVSILPKKDLVIALLYLDKLTLQICTRMNHIMNLAGVFFQVKCKTSNFFVFIERILLFLRSGIGYKFRYDGCTGTYYGKIKRHIKVRMCEHLGIWTLTWKRVKGDAIKEHL